MVQPSITYKSMLSSGTKIAKTIPIPDTQKRNQIYYIDTTMREFKESEDIWGFRLSLIGIENSIKSTFSIDNDITVIDRFSDTSRELYMGYVFYIDRTMSEVSVEPDSVLVAITKIGALIGIARLFYFVSALNEWQYEKKLALFHQSISN